MIPQSLLLKVSLNKRAHVSNEVNAFKLQMTAELLKVSVNSGNENITDSHTHFLQTWPVVT